MRPHSTSPTAKSSTSRLRRGIALATVLFTIAVVSALLTGIFWMTTQEQRLGENARRRGQSFGAAEVGVAEVIRTWNGTARNSMRLYPSDSALIPETATPSGAGKYSAVIRRLGRDLFLVDVTGRDPLSAAGAVRGTGSRQRVGVLIRTIPAVIVRPKGALATMGKLKLKDAAIVDGNDHIPAGWLDCPPLDTGVAGINTDPANKVKWSPPAEIRGNPPAATTMGAADTAALTATFDSLAALATVTMAGGQRTPAPVVTNGACDYGAPTNWGDVNPAAPCGAYMPIVHITGDLHIDNGVQGQGILLIDGDLHVKGKFTFNGIVLVLGKTKLKGDASGDPSITGYVVSRKKGKATAEDSVETSSTIAYSRCAVQTAMRAAGKTSVVRSRSWVQLF